MYSRGLFAIHMDCDMYQKRVIFDVCRKKCQKYLDNWMMIRIFVHSLHDKTRHRPSCGQTFYDKKLGK